jgi:hypothetical protein
MSNDDLNLRDTIIPKSDQLNYDDVASTTRTGNITAVSRGDSPDQPVVIHYEGEDGRPYKPCKSMRRVLIHAWGDNGHDWVGKRMTLYGDPEVKFGGVKVGGIRISHLSDIEQPLNISLTQTRGKRAPYKVEPLTTPEYPAAKFEKNFPAWKKSVETGKMTPEQIIKKIQQHGTLTPDQQAQVMALGGESAEPSAETSAETEEEF